MRTETGLAMVAPVFLEAPSAASELAMVAPVFMEAPAAATELAMVAPVFLGTPATATELAMVAPVFLGTPATATELAVVAPSFSPITGVEWLESDALILPCRLWRGSPAGRLREAVRDAAERGDVEAEKRFTAAYWRVVNQVFARRRLFDGQRSARRKELFRE